VPRPSLVLEGKYINIYLITVFVTRIIRRVQLVEQELLTLPEHLSSRPDFSGVHGTRSLVLCVCFVDRCLSFCTFSFGHCFVCSSSIYGFWLPLWYLQTLLYPHLFNLSFFKNNVYIYVPIVYLCIFARWILIFCSMSKSEFLPTFSLPFLFFFLSLCYIRGNCDSEEVSVYVEDGKLVFDTVTYSHYISEEGGKERK
jgi:hypothetical protein